MIANLDLSVVWRERSRDGLCLVFKALFYHDGKRHTTQWQCYFTSGLYSLSSPPLLGSPLSLRLVKSWKTRRTARAPLKNVFLVCLVLQQMTSMSWMVLVSSFEISTIQDILTKDRIVGSIFNCELSSHKHSVCCPGKGSNNLNSLCNV